jgi:prephenate dehydrogenase
MAGRERSGPEAARGDLFEGRPWVLTPGPHVGAEHLARVRELVGWAGADPVVMTAAAHDAAVALISHAPQLVASAMAAELVTGAAADLELAGPGIRDLTRIAASEPELWVDIVSANAGPVAAVLRGVVDRLATVCDSLTKVEEAADRRVDSSVPGAGGEAGMSTPRRSEEPTEIVLRRLLVAGNEGRSRLPGKHGAAPVPYAVVPVVIPDEAGALARLFAAAGEAGVNIEDVAIEHAPGQAVGLVELSVRPDRASALAQALQRGGWRVH